MDLDPRIRNRAWAPLEQSEKQLQAWWSAHSSLLIWRSGPSLLKESSIFVRPQKWPLSKKQKQKQKDTKTIVFQSKVSIRLGRDCF